MSRDTNKTDKVSNEDGEDETSASNDDPLRDAAALPRSKKHNEAQQQDTTLGESMNSFDITALMDAAGGPEITRPEPRPAPWSTTSSNTPRKNKQSLQSIMDEQQEQHKSKLGAQLDELRMVQEAQEEEMIRLALARSLTEMNASKKLNQSMSNMSTCSRASELAQSIQAEAERTEAVVDSPHSSLWADDPRGRESPRRTFSDGSAGESARSLCGLRNQMLSDSRTHSVSCRSLDSRPGTRRTNSDSSAVAPATHIKAASFSASTTTTPGAVGGGPIRIGPLPKQLVRRRSSRQRVAGAAAVLDFARENLSPEEVELVKEALRRGTIAVKTRKDNSISPSNSRHEPRSRSAPSTPLATPRKPPSILRHDPRHAYPPESGEDACVDLQQASEHLSPEEIQQIEQALRESSSQIDDVSGHSAAPKSPATSVQSFASSRSASKSPPALASRRSVTETTTTTTTTISSVYDLSGAEQNLSEEELRQIQLALEESEETGGGGSSGPVVAADPEELERKPAPVQTQTDTAEITKADAISQEDAAAIEKALREADEVEELKSLQLAMQMQEEEARMQQQTSFTRRQQGNVRTMTRGELEAEARVGAIRSTSPFPRVHPLEQEEEIRPALGFRMNTAARQEWSRRDQNSVIGPNDEVRTKHDPVLCGLSNAHRLGLEEDEDGSLALVGNKAYNSFMQSVRRTKKGVAAHGTGRAGSDADGTKGGAMDQNVRVQITRAINNGLIDRCNGVVKEGKEAIVYHADKGKESEGFDVAVKVFKRIQEFKGRGDYVDGDPRYAGANFRKTGNRFQLEMWAEKEYRNLVRANRAGVPVPTPLLQKENILFMRFLGTDGWPAPQLREVDIRPGSKRWAPLYFQVMVAIQKLYQTARLVHGDLSEYNILLVPVFQVENKAEGVENEALEVQAVLIDFGQSVDIRHPESKNLLQRDLQRVQSFFSRQGVNTMNAEEALAFVLGEEDERELR